MQPQGSEFCQEPEWTCKQFLPHQAIRWEHSLAKILTAASEDPEQMIQLSYAPENVRW